MSHPAPSPFFDPYDKDAHVYSPLSHGMAPPGAVPILPSGHAPAKPIVSLWKQQVLAISAGTVICILGILGMAAHFRSGPLYSAFISVNSFRGGVINAVNVGVIVAAFATLLSSAARPVLAGVSRAWIRRRAQGGQGITVKQWKTLAAGISIRDVRRTPFVAGGVILLFTLAIAGLNAALAGVAIPSAIERPTAGSLHNVAYLRGNGGIGGFTSCFNVSTECAQNRNIAEIATALTIRWIVSYDNAWYPVNMVQVVSDVGFLGAVTPDLTLAESSTRIVLASPVTKFFVGCERVNEVGIEGGSYYWTSACTNLQRRYYGNSTADLGSYMAAITCPSTNDNTAILELAASGYEYSRLSGRTFTDLPDRTFAVRCRVSAQEGTGRVTFFSDSGRLNVEPDPVPNYQPLSAVDIHYVSTAVIAAIATEYGLVGVSGPIQKALLLTLLDNNNRVRPDAIARGIGNAMAASASSAYRRLLGANSTIYSGRVYPSLQMLSYEQGYGWAPDVRLLAWSIICILIGLTWLLIAVYMVGGGMRYDPTDWYQTLNTSAGSNLQQVPGTCTGAHLEASKVNDQVLWYGELYPGHIGFAHQPTATVQAKAKYGGATTV